MQSLQTLNTFSLRCFMKKKTMEMNSKIIVSAVVIVSMLIISGCNKSVTTEPLTSNGKSEAIELPTPNENTETIETDTASHDSLDEKANNDTSQIENEEEVDLGYTAYASEEKIPEAMKLLEQVPQLTKQFDIQDVSYFRVSFYGAYIYLRGYDEQDNHICNVEYDPDNDVFSPTFLNNSSEYIPEQYEDLYVLNEEANTFIWSDGEETTIYEYDKEGHVITERNLSMDFDEEKLAEDVVEVTEFLEVYDSENECTFEGATSDEVYSGVVHATQDEPFVYMKMNYTRHEYKYDSNGNLIEEHSYSGETPDSLFHSAYHEYDENGNELSVKGYYEPDKTLSYSDASVYSDGKLVEREYKSDHSSWTQKYNYDANGNLLDYSYSSDDHRNTTCYSYNDKNLLIKEETTFNNGDYKSTNYYYSEDESISLELTSSHSNSQDDKFDSIDLSGKIVL